MKYKLIIQCNYDVNEIIHLQLYSKFNILFVGENMD